MSKKKINKNRKTKYAFYKKKRIGQKKSANF